MSVAVYIQFSNYLGYEFLKKIVRDKFPLYVSTGFMMVLFLNEENSTDLDNVGRVPCVRFGLEKEKHRFSQHQNSFSVSVTFLWLPFERSGLYQAQSPIFTQP
jgi:hypothetical protein